MGSCGVTMTSEPVDGAQEALTNSGLKWNSPDVNNFQIMKDYLTKEELNFLERKLRMNSQEWNNISQEFVRLQLREEEGDK